MSLYQLYQAFDEVHDATMIHLYDTWAEYQMRANPIEKDRLCNLPDEWDNFLVQKFIMDEHDELHIYGRTR